MASSTTPARVPAQLEGATVDFLRKHAPFNEMDDDALRMLVANFKLEYFPKGATIIGPDSGVARTLYLVQRGVVHGVAGGADGGPRAELEAGEMFPIGAVIGARPTTLRYQAVEDVFCYEIDAGIVETLMQRSPPFQRFCTRYMSALMRQASSRLQASMSRESLGEQNMLAPLSVTVKRKPVTVAPGTSLKGALETMQKNKISAVVVVDDGEKPVGIFTERDLVRHTVAGAVDPAAPISRYMTPDPVGLATTATLADAALEMARRNIRHLLVCDHGRLVGVVSERSLFALQRLSMRQVTNVIDLAEDEEGLKSGAAEIRALARNMLAQGISAEQLTQLIAALNDKLTERILALHAGRHDLAGIRFAWLALGSEGRHEQTFSTDQDNAIIFVTPEDTAADAMRARLLAFAVDVNATLDACGFPLCKGKVMASNPEWCLSEPEWRVRFGHWIRNPLPEALLNANIFFDFRPLWGEVDLARGLREWLHGITMSDQRFLKMMAQNALQSAPPLGFFGDVVTSGEGEEKGTVDLKSQGTRIFTDAARIYGLAKGVVATNTAARLREAGAQLGIRSEETEALADAFYFLLLLRLRHQHLERSEGTSANRIRPRDLNDLDQRILKESFRQARKLQKRLSVDYLV